MLSSVAPVYDFQCDSESSAIWGEFERIGPWLGSDRMAGVRRRGQEWLEPAVVRFSVLVDYQNKDALWRPEGKLWKRSLC